jgi:tRNA(Ile)-lysidine synthase
MIEDFKHFISGEGLFVPSDRILLAVSGGLDSVVMSHLFLQAGLHFAIAHANFQLRGEESERDERFVRNLAEKYKVELFVRHFETQKFSRSEKVSIQVAARQLRYNWFDELLLKEGFDFVATAHHLDDQVETFLINLTRGTGIAGLHGILPKQGKLIRPLLFSYRSEIERYARENCLEYVEDSSNLGDKYLRNRIRHKIIPEIEKISPGFSRELTQTIGNIRAAETIYQLTVEKKRKELFQSKGDQTYVNANQFFSLKPLKSWVYELLSPFGFNQSNAGDIAGLVDSIPGKEVRSASFRLIRDREQLIIVPLENKDKYPGLVISMDDLLEKSSRLPSNLSFEILDKSPTSLAGPANTAFLDLGRLTFPLVIRKWQRGDYFYPLGMSQPKKLSDFFTDLKFSRIMKEQTRLLCSSEDIVWIIGHRIDDRYKITRASKKILKITASPESVSS